MEPSRPAPRVPATSPFVREEPVERPIPDYCIGDRVTHDHYGLGRVVALHSTPYVTVDFGDLVVRLSRASAALSPI